MLYVVSEKILKRSTLVLTVRTTYLDPSHFSPFKKGVMARNSFVDLSTRWSHPVTCFLSVSFLSPSDLDSNHMTSTRSTFIHIHTFHDENGLFSKSYSFLGLNIAEERSIFSFLITRFCTFYFYKELDLYLCYDNPERLFFLFDNSIRLILL